MIPCISFSVSFVLDYSSYIHSDFEEIVKNLIDCGIILICSFNNKLSFLKRGGGTHIKWEQKVGGRSEGIRTSCSPTSYKMFHKKKFSYKPSWTMRGSASA
jgi:hypothetical protein